MWPQRSSCRHGGGVCLRKNLKPRDLLVAPRMAELQRELLRMGQVSFQAWRWMIPPISRERQAFQLPVN